MASKRLKVNISNNQLKKNENNAKRQVISLEKRDRHGRLGKIEYICLKPKRTLRQQSTVKFNYIEAVVQLKQSIQKFKKIYKNDSKIMIIIIREINLSQIYCYVYKKQIIQLAKQLVYGTTKMAKRTLKGDYLRFVYDLLNLKDFLLEWYENKKIVQIQQIQNNIISNYNSMRKSLDQQKIKYQDYIKVNNKDRVALKMRRSLCQDLQQATNKYGQYKNLSKVTWKIFQELYKTQERILDAFQQNFQYQKYYEQIL